MQNLISNELETYAKNRIKEFNTIHEARIKTLDELSELIKSKKGKDINLTFICTHNSRRSHLAQIWAQAASYYYGIENVKCYSGGTEATAFYPSAVDAIKNAGFNVIVKTESTNPVYEVSYTKDNEALKCFSKIYDDDFNPKENFIAVMTCSHADENCPFIPGTDHRIAITYNDPKEFDGTDFEQDKYDERCADIAREMLYLFFKIA